MLQVTTWYIPYLINYETENQHPSILLGEKKKKK